MSKLYDIAVVGSGYAGSIFAMIARRLGRSVLLLESGRHPRVVIGESSTPLSNLLLEELSDRYGLPVLKSMSKWGSWRRDLPEVACGLKRGFTFFHHDLDQPDRNRPLKDQLLVAASPSDEIADTHWYRADCDEFLVREAQSLGVRFVDEVKGTSFTDTGQEVLLRGTKNGEQVTFRARFVVDATGPRGFLFRELALSEAPFPDYPETQALYSHFSGVGRLDSHATQAPAEPPPYPIDDAAVHHVFDGGWIWVLKFRNGRTSAGVAATAACSERLGLGPGQERGEEAWRRLLKSIPALDAQFSKASMEQPFTYIPKLSFLSSAIVGERWAMLPSAAGFVDPLLSTGFPLNLIGVSRLAQIMEHASGTPAFPNELQIYAMRTEQELLATARLIRALYASMNSFPAFRSLSLLYFATASFAESARRLKRPDLATSFLLHDRAGFGEQCRHLLDGISRSSAAADFEAIRQEVHRIIEPIDVAGLRREQSNFCYPVLAEDLMDNAWKLESTEEQAMQLLERSGFFSDLIHSSK